MLKVGFVTVPHTVTPFKAKRGDQLTPEQARFNSVIALVRSRVERMFAYETNVKGCMTTAVAIMFLILGNDPQYKCVCELAMKAPLRVK
jgi:hypothetical protein